MTSITVHNKKGGLRLWAVLFWLGAWQVAAMTLGEPLLLVTPLAVAVRLGELAVTAPFWAAVGFSTARIFGGFLLACAAAVLAAALAARLAWVRELLHPLVATVKAVPVASFIIIALLWVPSRNLALLIAALMVFPPVYGNVLTGIQETDKGLLEMAQVFGVPFARRLRGIYVPAVLPYFRAACSLGLGLCWKAGIAAEVIGLPQGSLGERLHGAKVLFETPDLFAWTVTIVAVAAAFERLFLLAVAAVTDGRGARHGTAH